MVETFNFMILFPRAETFAVCYGLLRHFGKPFVTVKAFAPRKSLQTYAKSFLMRASSKS